jgi:hypothetical protein
MRRKRRELLQLRQLVFRRKMDPMCSSQLIGAFAAALALAHQEAV